MIPIPWRLLPLPALAFLMACPAKPTDTDTSEPSDADTDTDTDTDSDTDTDTDTGGEAFAEAVNDATFREAIDVVATADTLYAVGFDDEGSPVVVSVATSGGAVTVLASGGPLVMPSGICLSADGSTVYVSDVASDQGTMNGGVYSLPSGGGTLTEIGTAGTIDRPGDVTLGHGGSTVYVSGFTSEGQPAVFSVDLGTGAASVAVQGAPLVDPTQLDQTEDGTKLYVLDSLAADGHRAQVFEFTTPGFASAVVAEGFQTNFPGGLSVADSGATVFYTTVGDPSLMAYATDGSGTEELDTLGLLELPAGVCTYTDAVYVTETSSLGGADIYSLSY
jgi:DNA-binding beta-propeller fold protein YncE